MNKYRIGTEGDTYAYIWAERFSYDNSARYEKNEVVLFWIGAVIVGECLGEYFDSEVQHA